MVRRAVGLGGCVPASRRSAHAVPSACTCHSSLPRAAASGSSRRPRRACEVWSRRRGTERTEKEFSDAKIRRRRGGGGSEQPALNGFVRHGEWRTGAVALQIGTPRFGST